MTPLWPVESWCTRDPCITQVTISMSWCGWVSKPVPGATTSSLFTSSSPWWVLAGSWCRPKLKECLLSSHASRVVGRSPARRTSTPGVRLAAFEEVITESFVAGVRVEMEAGVQRAGLPQAVTGGNPGPCGEVRGWSGGLDRGDLELQD